MRAAALAQASEYVASQESAREMSVGRKVLVLEVVTESPLQYLAICVRTADPAFHMNNMSILSTATVLLLIGLTPPLHVS